MAKMQSRQELLEEVDRLTKLCEDNGVRTTMSMQDKIDERVAKAKRKLAEAFKAYKEYRNELDDTYRSQACKANDEYVELVGLTKKDVEDSTGQVFEFQSPYMDPPMRVVELQDVMSNPHRMTATEVRISQEQIGRWTAKDIQIEALQKQINKMTEMLTKQINLSAHPMMILKAEGDDVEQIAEDLLSGKRVLRKTMRELFNLVGREYSFKDFESFIEWLTDNFEGDFDCGLSNR